MSDAGQKPEEIQTNWQSWLVGACVGLQYAATNCVRQVWSTSIPVAAPALGITMTAAGGLMTAYYIGYVISNFVTGFMVDAYGPRKCLFFGSLLTGLFTLAIPFSNGYLAMFLLRIGAGLASGPLFASVVKYQISWFSPQTRATAMSYMMAFSSIGLTMSSLVFAPIVRTYGWQRGFIWAGFMAVGAAVIIMLFGKEKGPSAQRGRTGGKNAAPLTEEEKAAAKAGLRSVIMKKSFLFGTIGCFLSLGGNNSFNTWITSYFVESRGFTLVQAGLIVGAAAAIRLFTGPLAGATSDLLKTKKKLSVFGATTTVACTLMLMYFPRNIALLMGVMIARSIFASFASQPLNALQSQAAAGPYAGRAMGFYNGTAQIGSIVFPLVYGLILDISGGNYLGTLWTGLVLTILTAVCIANMTEIVVPRKKKAAA